MFIENKKSWIFLAKKVFWKKILVKITEEGITENLLVTLTKKECDFIFDSENYKNFALEIYNEWILKNVIFKSKFLSNNIEVLDVLKLRNKLVEDKKLTDNLNREEITYKQWFFFKWWIKNTFPKKFIFNSNNIEGSRIPEEEVEKIIENKKYAYKVKNEIHEVQNSFNSWNFLNEKFVFNEANIKKLYHILTKDLLQENWEKYPRWFKKVKIVVNNSNTTDPDNVSSEIVSLINHYKSNKNKILPFQLAFDFHLKYEQIHPFENWNWRTWRLLMNKILIQNGMVPMIVFNDNKQSYFNAISSCSSWRKKKYYNFMLEQYNKTINESYNFSLWKFELYNNIFKNEKIKNENLSLD